MTEAYFEGGVGVSQEGGGLDNEDCNPSRALGGSRYAVAEWLRPRPVIEL